MQHGDGEGPSDEGYGKILHSGIMPGNWDNIQPAEYALEEGVDALMDDPDRRRRRQLMMMGGCGLLAFGAGSFAAGMVFGGEAVPGSSVPRERTPKSSEFRVREGLSENDLHMIALNRAAARGSIEDLVNDWGGYVMTIRFCGGDLELWEGVRRLAEYSLSTGGEEPRRIAREIVTLLESRRHPRFMTRLLPKLRVRKRMR